MKLRSFPLQTQKPTFPLQSSRHARRAYFQIKSEAGKPRLAPRPHLKVVLSSFRVRISAYACVNLLNTSGTNPLIFISYQAQNALISSPRTFYAYGVLKKSLSSRQKMGFHDSKTPMSQVWNSHQSRWVVSY